MPAGDSSAGRLTKDLLRHGMIPERVLSFAAGWQAVRSLPVRLSRHRGSRCEGGADIPVCLPSCHSIESRGRKMCPRPEPFPEHAVP